MKDSDSQSKLVDKEIEEVEMGEAEPKLEVQEEKVPEAKSITIEERYACLHTNLKEHFNKSKTYNEKSWLSLDLNKGECAPGVRAGLQAGHVLTQLFFC